MKAGRRNGSEMKNRADEFSREEQRAMSDLRNKDRSLEFAGPEEPINSDAIAAFSRLRELRKKLSEDTSVTLRETTFDTIENGAREMVWLHVVPWTQTVLVQFCDGPFPWLKTALRNASYIEDVMALEHFVFHARHNVFTGACLACEVCPSEMSLEEIVADPTTTSHGHLASCEFIAAIRRVVPKETLAAYATRK